MANEIIKQLTMGLSEILVYVMIALVFLFGIAKCIYPVYRNSVLLNRAVIKLGAHHRQQEETGLAGASLSRARAAAGVAAVFTQRRSIGPARAAVQYGGIRQ